MSNNNFDIFISFKDNFDGVRTWASKKGEHIYNSLRVKGYNPFFSDVTMNTEFAASISEHVDYALGTAKVMILVFSSPKEVNSKWVRHEWSEFMRMKKPIITVFKGMKSEDWDELQPELADMQGIDLTDEVGVYQYNRIFETVEQYMTGKVPSSVPEPPRKEEKKIVPAQPVKKTPRVPRLNVQVGCTITFGQYPQGANGEIEPLKWRVLDVRGEKALLITDKIIDCVDKFSIIRTREPYTWRTSSLRRWMNNVFFGKAFNWEQQQKIITVSNGNPDDAYSDSEEYVTEDKIFALSVNEAERYFATNVDRKASASAYAELLCHSRCPWDDKGAWWLRSPIKERAITKASYVSEGGHIEDRYKKWSSPIYDSEIGVRPAMWISLS